MDGKSMAFLQKEAAKAIAECFESGLNLDNLLQCAVIQVQFYEAMQQSLVEALPPAQPWACESGCAACCRRKVACTIPEVISIAAWLSECSEEEKQRIRADAQHLHDSTAELDDLGRVRAALPCPLLVEQRCSVYEVRPIACRAVYSFDRKACESFFLGHDFATRIPLYDLMAEAHGQMLLGYSRALDKLGLDGGLVELASALLILLNEPDAIDRYLAGEHVFEPAKLGRFRQKPV
jgi:Fe-S-cluster containining protein